MSRCHQLKAVVSSSKLMVPSWSVSDFRNILRLSAISQVRKGLYLVLPRKASSSTTDRQPLLWIRSAAAIISLASVLVIFPGLNFSQRGLSH